MQHSRAAPTRRHFIAAGGLAAASALCAAAELPPYRLVFGSRTCAEIPPSDDRFPSLASIFDGPLSPFFGVKMQTRTEDFGNGSSGQRLKRLPLDPQTYYMAGGISGEEEPHSFFLSFEISNQQILCSATSTGCLQNPLIFSRMVEARRRGRTFQSPLLVGGSAWSFGVRRQGGDAYRLPTTHGSTVRLLNALYPIFGHASSELELETLAFAPDAGASIEQNPRALIVVVRARNVSSALWKGDLLVPNLQDACGPVTDAWIASPAESPHPRFPEHPVPIAPGYEAILTMPGTEWSPAAPSIAFDLATGAQHTFSFALLLDSTPERLKAAAASIGRKSALEWFNLTWRTNARRYGELKIEGGQYYAELLQRMVEEDRAAILRSDNGELFSGGPGGASFSLAWFQPEAPAQDIPAMRNFHKRPAGQPPWANPADSLVNTLGLLPWAGLYYCMTGDARVFRDVPAYLDYAQQTLDDILATRKSDAWLFPSKMLWDGPTPGDFNTGANVMAWLGFAASSRLAGEVYGRADLASKWSATAARIRQDLYKHCVGPGKWGPQFFQGGNLDGSLVHGHDGEEAFTTMAAFFGFCEPDDPAIRNYARAAFTTDNPLYAPEVDGIWWGERVFGSGTTMPAQMAKLIAGADQRDLATNLESLRKLVDLDGSLWWWPYLYPCNDPHAIERRGHPADTSKCGYAAAVYAAVLCHQYPGNLQRCAVAQHPVSALHSVEELPLAPMPPRPGGLRFRADAARPHLFGGGPQSQSIRLQNNPGAGFARSLPVRARHNRRPVRRCFEQHCQVCEARGACYRNIDSRQQGRIIARHELNQTEEGCNESQTFSRGKYSGRGWTWTQGVFRFAACCGIPYCAVARYAGALRPEPHS
jgi:hypothetical protein